MLEVLAQNKKLQYINLGHNILCDDSFTEKEQREFLVLLGTIIKKNKSLLHLDLSSCGLTKFIVQKLGKVLRRAPSLLSIHLTGNFGNFAKLAQSIKCRPLENIDRFTRIQTYVNELIKSLPPQLELGVLHKMSQ